MQKKKPTNNNSSSLNFKSECPFRFKIAIIDNKKSRVKLISSSKRIFHKELKNIKHIIIGTLTILSMNKLNVQLKIVANKHKHFNTRPNKHVFIKFLSRSNTKKHTPY